MTATLTLATWLGEQLAADEAVALAAIPSSAYEWDAQSYKVVADGEFEVAEANVKTAAHIALHDPARVLAQIAAVREVLAPHVPGYDSPSAEVWGHDARCDECQQTWPCRTIKITAKPYADRPGYAEVAG